jgi:hypothetical protein
MTWADSPYIIILYYRGYTCGKFLSNILAFNNNFIPQLRYPEISHLVRSRPNYSDVENAINEIKIKQIFSTVPPSKEECLNWLKYELGEGDLFYKYQSAGYFLNNKKYCFIVAHDIPQLHQLQHHYKNAQIIELINDEQVLKLSRKLKVKQEELDQFPTDQFFKLETVDYSIKFDIGSMFNQNDFFNNVNDLLEKFNIDDKTLDNRVFTFYNSYMELYK